MSIYSPNRSSLAEAIPPISSGMADAPTDAASPSPPLYVAALVVTICGIFAVNIVMPEVEWSFVALTIGLSVIGFLVSYISRKQGIAPRSIELPAVILCAGFCLMAVFSDSLLSMLAPPSIGDDKARSLAVLLTWLSVFRSFTLLTDGHLLFCCVPTLAMIGLSSTLSTDSSLVMLFVVFVAAAAFLLVHENFLRTRPTINDNSRTDRKIWMFGSQVQLTALCMIGALALANVVALPMRTIGSYMIFSAGLVPPNRITRDILSAARVSFSESDEKRVGTGPVNASNQIVMVVRANHGAYWRGATFDQYTGRGWRTSFSRDMDLTPQQPASGDLNELLNAPSSGDFVPSGSNRFLIPPTLYTKTGGKTHRLRQVISLRNGLFSEFYAAAEPRILKTYEGRLNMDPTGGLHLYRSVNGQVYEVESEIPDASPETLRAASTTYPPEITDRYLALPTTPAIQRIQAAVSEIVRSLPSTYDKVSALEKWVGEQCKYNTNTPAIPEGEDVASYFLFTGRQGYCDSFATALAVACRTAGIPARVASGFRSGDLDHTSREYVVRERDKHMWTEVYFPGVGWIPFDSTGYADDISQNPVESQKKKQSLIAFFLGRGWLPPMAMLAFLGMLSYVLKVEVLDRLRKSKPVSSPLGLPASNLAVVDYYETACHELARRGIPRSSALTPMEYRVHACSRLEQWPDACAMLERLTSLVARFRYSRETATDEDVRLAREAVTDLRRALRGVSRRVLTALETAQG